MFIAIATFNQNKDRSIVLKPSIDTIAFLILQILEFDNNINTICNKINIDNIIYNIANIIAMISISDNNND